MSSLRLIMEVMATYCVLKLVIQVLAIYKIVQEYFTGARNSFTDFGDFENFGRCLEDLIFYLTIRIGQ